MEPLTPQVMHKLVFTILVHGLPDSQTGIALDLLANALKSPNGQVRELAVVALTDIAVSPSKRVSLLKEALRDPYARVRRRATRALGDFGSHAHSAMLQITFGLRDPDPSVRRDSAGTLGRLGPAAHGAVPALVNMLNEHEGRTRAVASVALKRIGRDAVPGLLQGLESSNAELRGRCATLLSQIAPDDPRAVAALRIIAADRDTTSLAETPIPMATPVPELSLEEFAISVG